MDLKLSWSLGGDRSGYYDLPELSDLQSMSMNLKLPLSGGG